MNYLQRSKQQAHLWSVTHVYRHAGDIVGIVEMSAGMEEDTENLYGADPIECPSRPPQDLHLATFQVHLVRLSSFIDDIKQLVATYQFVVSWRSPPVTGVSFLVFLHLCRRFNPAYIGSVPFFFLGVWMIYLAFSRCRGRLKKRSLSKVLDDLRRVSKRLRP